MTPEEEAREIVGECLCMKHDGKPCDGCSVCITKGCGWCEYGQRIASALRSRTEVAEAADRLQRIRLIAQGASAKEPAATLFARLLAISLEADGVTSESGRFV